MSLFALLSPRYKNDILLRAIDVVILEEENTINAVFLQGRELDQSFHRSNKVFLKDEMFLAWNLEDVSAWDLSKQHDGRNAIISRFRRGLTVHFLLFLRILMFQLAREPLLICSRY